MKQVSEVGNKTTFTLVDSDCSSQLVDIENFLFSVSDSELEEMGSPLVSAAHTIFTMKQLSCRC